ncbi:MAG: hypothetical protein ACK553_14035 [Planctomycetota bacterium]
MTSSIPPSKLSQFARVFALGCTLVGLLGWYSSPVQAGCHAGGISTSMRVPESAKVGGLPLRLYPSYAAGGMSFSLFPPAVPCDGLKCGAQPRMKPAGTTSWSLRLVTSTASRPSLGEDWSSPQTGHSNDHPLSVSAPRGAIGPLEHPPKPSAS